MSSAEAESVRRFALVDESKSMIEFSSAFDALQLGAVIFLQGLVNDAESEIVLRDMQVVFKPEATTPTICVFSAEENNIYELEGPCHENYAAHYRSWQQQMRWLTNQQSFSLSTAGQRHCALRQPKIVINQYSLYGADLEYDVVMGVGKKTAEEKGRAGENALDMLHIVEGIVMLPQDGKEGGGIVGKKRPREVNGKDGGGQAPGQAGNKDMAVVEEDTDEDETKAGNKMKVKILVKEYVINLGGGERSKDGEVSMRQDGQCGHYSGLWVQDCEGVWYELGTPQESYVAYDAASRQLYDWSYLQQCYQYQCEDKHRSSRITEDGDETAADEEEEVDDNRENFDVPLLDEVRGVRCSRPVANCTVYSSADGEEIQFSEMEPGERYVLLADLQPVGSYSGLLAPFHCRALVDDVVLNQSFGFGETYRERFQISYCFRGLNGSVFYQQQAPLNRNPSYRKIMKYIQLFSMRDAGDEVWRQIKDVSFWDRKGNLASMLDCIGDGAVFEMFGTMIPMKLGANPLRTRVLVSTHTVDYGSPRDALSLRGLWLVDVRGYYYRFMMPCHPEYQRFAKNDLRVVDNLINLRESIINYSQHEEEMEEVDSTQFKDHALDFLLDMLVGEFDRSVITANAGLIAMHLRRNLVSGVLAFEVVRRLESLANISVHPEAEEEASSDDSEDEGYAQEKSPREDRNDENAEEVEDEGEAQAISMNSVDDARRFYPWLVADLNGGDSSAYSKRAVLACQYCQKYKPTSPYARFRMRYFFQLEHHEKASSHLAAAECAKRNSGGDIEKAIIAVQRSAELKDKRRQDYQNSKKYSLLIGSGEVNSEEEEFEGGVVRQVSDQPNNDTKVAKSSYQRALEFAQQSSLRITYRSHTEVSVSSAESQLNANNNEQSTEAPELATSEGAYAGTKQRQLMTKTPDVRSASSTPKSPQSSSPIDAFPNVDEEVVNFEVLDRVSCWNNFRKRWLPAQIVGARELGGYDVMFDDGEDVVKNISPMWIRRAEKENDLSNLSQSNQPERDSVATGGEERLQVGDKVLCRDQHGNWSNARIAHVHSGTGGETNYDIFYEELGRTETNVRGYFLKKIGTTDGELGNGGSGQKSTTRRQTKFMSPPSSQGSVFVPSTSDPEITTTPMSENRGSKPPTPRAGKRQRTERNKQNAKAGKHPSKAAPGTVDMRIYGSNAEQSSQSSNIITPPGNPSKPAGSPRPNSSSIKLLPWEVGATPCKYCHGLNKKADCRNKRHVDGFPFAPLAVDPASEHNLCPVCLHWRKYPFCKFPAHIDGQPYK